LAESFAMFRPKSMADCAKSANGAEPPIHVDPVAAPPRAMSSITNVLPIFVALINFSILLVGSPAQFSVTSKYAYEISLAYCTDKK
jgi:hypothetical protein